MYTIAISEKRETRDKGLREWALKVAKKVCFSHLALNWDDPVDEDMDMTREGGGTIVGWGSTSA